MEYEEWEDEQYDWAMRDTSMFEGPLSGKVIKVEDYGGVAFYVDGYTTRRMDANRTRATEVIQCHMIGDDRQFFFDPGDYGITVLEDDQYCSECGQVGCGWGVH